MSAASSDPYPRSKAPGSGSGTGSQPRYSLFWPLAIFFAATCVHATYQIYFMEDQLDSVTRAIDQIDAKVKRADYERTKLYNIAKDLTHLAATDPVAQQIVTQYGIRNAHLDDPVPNVASAITSAVTNAAPPTNSAPAAAPAPR